MKISGILKITAVAGILLAVISGCSQLGLTIGDRSMLEDDVIEMAAEDSDA